MPVLISNRPPRELLIALPGCETNLYRVHQHVWRHVDRFVGQVTRRPEFIYRIDAGMIRVRSLDIPANRALVSMFRAKAPVQIDLSAVWGVNHDNPVPEANLAEWGEEKLASAGFRVDKLAVTEYQYRHGTKRLAGNVHHIRIPVVSITAEVTVVDADESNQAWNQGIGRGKRFGLGMLAQ